MKKGPVLVHWYVKAKCLLLQQTLEIKFNEMKNQYDILKVKGERNLSCKYVLE